jgi:dienelactone hydrolase
MLSRMPTRVLVGLLAAVVTGCASHGATSFPNATPGVPRIVPATELRPAGKGPFPAVVLLHGCQGVTPTIREWGAWFRERGYVALIVDSWAARGMEEGCTPGSADFPNTERLDDAIGALRYLRTRPHVDRERIGAIGWSNGGVHSIAVVNGPSLERAKRRGVDLPSPGYRAAVAVYPGGCFSLVHERVIRPLLVLIGGKDDWTIPGPCVEMVEAMRGRGADAEIVVYPDAYHYFDVAGLEQTFLDNVENRNVPGDCCGATVAYDAVADADARRRIAEFFGYHLKRP